MAGCATGEEAYSIAMLLCEHRDTLADPPDIQVFATDIDEAALARAREGHYAEVAAPTCRRSGCAASSTPTPRASA